MRQGRTETHLCRKIDSNVDCYKASCLISCRCGRADISLRRFPDHRWQCSFLVVQYSKIVRAASISWCRLTASLVKLGTCRCQQIFSLAIHTSGAWTGWCWATRCHCGEAPWVEVILRVSDAAVSAVHALTTTTCKTWTWDRVSSRWRLTYSEWLVTSRKRKWSEIAGAQNEDQNACRCLALH